jgi:hypothetical protein
VTKDHAELWAAYLTAQVRQAAQQSDDTDGETDDTE